MSATSSTSLSVSSIRQADLAELDHLVSQNFNFPKGESFIKNFPRLFKDSNLHNLYCIRDQKQKIVSHVGSLQLVWRFSQEISFNLLVIGAVATDSQHRGEGLASRLIEKALDSHQEWADLAVLWGEREALYSKSGFVSVQTDELHWFPDRSSQVVPSQSYRIESLEGEGELGSHLKDFMELYERQAHYIERTRLDWESLFKVPGATWFVARSKKDQALLAYLVVGKGQDFQGIAHELIGPSGALEGLIGEAQRKLSLLGGISPIWDKNLAQVFLKNGSMSSERIGGMWTLLNQKSFLEKLQKIGIPVRTGLLESLGELENKKAFLGEILQSEKLGLFIQGFDSH